MEIVGELLPWVADGVLRRLHVSRTRRRLAAGRPVRIPCALRRDGPGPTREPYVDGRLRLAPGAGAATFTARRREPVPLAVGGTFHDPEPDTWHSQDWAAKAYRPPGGPPLYLQVDSRYLPLLYPVLGGGAHPAGTPRPA
ncbi:hypothetical protein [Kitasatospora sp. NPDC057015]|uniref:hypothetical protein n=1 Tax=Kitasatospora sp. NPDC057015 TaxID=3346001 RepID=UPI0036294A08